MGAGIAGRQGLRQRVFRPEQRLLWWQLLRRHAGRQFDGGARNVQFGEGGADGKLLNLAAVAVARVKIHIGIDAGRILLELAVDDADLFGKLQPIVDIQLAQTGNGTCYCIFQAGVAFRARYDRLEARLEHPQRAGAARCLGHVRRTDRQHLEQDQPQHDRKCPHLAQR